MWKEAGMIIFFGWMPKIYFFQLPKLNKYCLRVELALAHGVIEKLKMDHLWVYKLYPTSCCNGYRMSSPESSNQNFLANYMNMFLLWAKPLSDPAWVRAQCHDTQTWPYLQSKRHRWTKIPSIILKCVQNARNYLSNEGFCLKFGRFFAEILKSEYEEISPWSPYWNLRCFQG